MTNDAMRDWEYPEPPILDVRLAEAFEACHRVGAVNIPLEELPQRIHELPSPYIPLIIFDSDHARAEAARRELVGRERSISAVHSGEDYLRSGSTETGPSNRRLWRPHKLTVQAMAVARTQWGDVRGKRVLDLASGTGRDAVYLAMQGMSVEAWDILPDALDRLRDLAVRNGVKVTACVRDVERDSLIPPETYDMIVCFNFLYRPLMSAIAQGIRTGGLLVYETFAGPQREMFGKPTREAFVLRSGELPSYFDGYERIEYREHLAAPRRFVASLIAMRNR
ncbi:MAG: methyltransferase domain-containing protein [Planctomycetes bacterium]|nr:methyltransferase domain-containing protein [Planctomycetota bacterium]